jgi:HlyD family secretion protein
MTNKKFFTKKKIIIFIIIAATILLVVGGVLATRGGSKTTYVTDKAVKKNLLQTVSEVGTVQSPTQIDLSFSNPGTLQTKLVGIGDKVKTGQILAQLDLSSLSFQRDQAAANLAAAQASLDKLLRGAATGDIAVARAQSDSVAVQLAQAQKSLNDLLDSGPATPTTYEQTVITAQAAMDNAKAVYQKGIDNSIENLINDINAKLPVANTALDNINTILTDADIKNYLGSNNKSYVVNAGIDYSDALTLLDSANAGLTAAMNDKSQANLDSAAVKALNCLKKVSDSLDNLYNALENSVYSSAALLAAQKTTVSGQISAVSAAISVVGADQQTFDGAELSYNSNVSAAQNNLNQAQAAYSGAVLAAQNSVKTAQQSLAVAQKQLAQLTAPPRPEDISLAQAKVNEAQSALDLAGKQIDNSIIKSPIDGQVVKDNFNVGEQVGAAVPAFSVLAENNFEISVDISESDIIKVKDDDAVEVTLDAFGPDVKFNAGVYFIEPASTVIQDVIYYKVKIRFSETADKLAGVKPGMTANVTIITDKRENVLTVPERAIIEKENGDKIVRIMAGGKITEAPVKTGLRGDDGSIEILEGNVHEGDVVVILINTK